ncbi:MAG: DUF3515 domain-containing protein [Actinomycetota bacterium]|nr:DUF3515 domain-containing protein [Actinomycetota bacterium]
MRGLGEPVPLPRRVLTAVVALSVLLVAAVLLASVLVRSQGSEPLPLATVPAPEGGSPECTALVAALPEDIDTGENGAGTHQLDRRSIADPAPAGTAAWGEPPVVLRCGLDRPAELTVGSRLLAVSGVQFLEIPGPGATSWVVVDRPVYIALTVPEGSGSAAVQQVAGAVRRTLPRTEIDLGAP